MDLIGERSIMSAFVVSKAFYMGVSMDHIMQAFQWKSHSTFTKFYLKDLAGQDLTEGFYHLGAFVAVLQVIHQCLEVFGTTTKTIDGYWRLFLS